MLSLKPRNTGSFRIFLILSLLSLSKSLPVQQPVNSRPGNDLVKSMNESANPCTDFYEYTCGRWTNEHPPMEYLIRWSNGNIMSHSVRSKIERLLNRTDSETENETIRKAQKVYRACMNKDEIEAAGADPIKNLVNENGGWPLIMKPGEWRAKNLTWQQIHSKLIRTFRTEPLFAIQVSPDPKNSSVTRLEVSQPDLILKKKELIDPKELVLASAYKSYKFRVADILLRKPSESSSEKLYNHLQLVDMNDFEKDLAKLTRDDRSVKDIDKWYSLMTIDELQELYDSANMTSPTAQINWLETIRDLFTLTPEITVDGSEQIIVLSKEFFPKFAALLNKTSPETIVNYMMWYLIADASLYTNDELRKVMTNFNNERVGADPVGTREYDCVSADQMQRAASYAFVKEHFSQDSKKAAQQLVENIQEAMKNYIRQSTWLDNETKNLATEKINAIIKFIGFPDDYTDSNIDEYYAEFTPTDSYFENEMRSRVFTMKRILRDIRKPTNKNKWLIDPRTIAAYYLLVLNTMVVPAGFLQLPFFDENRPSVMNYAMIGAAIGHEISHALDNDGLRFDKNGNAVTWWSQPNIDKYEEQAECFVNQFNNYTIYEDDRIRIPVNGTLTVDENISDSTGLKVAWDAYKIFREGHGASLSIPGLERFTDDQIFFLSFGNMWCAYESDMYLQLYAPKDVHSPARARVNGAVSNIPAFAEAFNCTEDSFVNPLKKCNIF